jgi:hypothetical protein
MHDDALYPLQQCGLHPIGQILPEAKEDREVLVVED